MATITVLDSTGATQTLQAPNANGQGVMAASRSIVIASDQSAVPVSGTDGANLTLGTKADVAWASGSGSAIALLKTIATQATSASGSLVSGTATTAAPTYTNATNNALSLNLTGGLRVDGSGVTQPVSLASTTVSNTVTVSGAVTVSNASLAVTGSFFQTTQPVSGTVTVGNASLPVTGTFFQATQPVSLASTTITGTVATSLASTTITGSVAVTGAFFQTTQPVSLASTTITGAVSTNATLQTGTNVIGSAKITDGTNTVGITTGIAASSESLADRMKVNAELRLLDTVQTAGSQLVAAKGDQTSGLWVNVKASAALPAGANLIGSVLVPETTFFNDSTTVLTATATFTGTTRDVGVAAGTATPTTYFNGFFFADQAGTASLEVSNDNTIWRTAASSAISISTPLILTVPVMTRYHRVKLVNGATLQGAVMVNSSFSGS